MPLFKAVLRYNVRRSTFTLHLELTPQTDTTPIPYVYVDTEHTVSAHASWQRKVLEIANDEGMQLLHLAAAEGRVAILRFALQQDNVLPLVSSADKHGWTPLHHGSFI